MADTAPVPAYENKYTDRDVREDPSLTPLVYQYLHEYGGSFDFLVDAKRQYEGDRPLPTSVIRGVLNCMRVDLRWAHRLPAPRWPNEDGGTVTGAEVIEMKERRARRPKGPSNRVEQCDDTDPHHMHWWGDHGPDKKCEGVPWPINREAKSLPILRLHKWYAKAPTGALIHRVHPNLTRSQIIYSPPPHEYGWGPKYAWAVGTRYALTFQLEVKVACKSPSYIRRPVLLSLKEAQDAVTIGQIGLGWCKTCFPNGDPKVEAAPF